jgi:hypothetical protein
MITIQNSWARQASQAKSAITFVFPFQYPEQDFQMVPVPKAGSTGAKRAFWSVRIRLMAAYRALPVHGIT